MGYVDYNFYVNDYYGDTIPESSFLKYCDKAESYLHQFTYRRLAAKLPTKRGTAKQVKKCICELAEQLYALEQYLKSTTIQEDGKTKMVKSVSAGSESVTYAGSDTPYAAMAKSPKEVTELLYRITVRYPEFTIITVNEEEKDIEYESFTLTLVEY